MIAKMKGHKVMRSKDKSQHPPTQTMRAQITSESIALEQTEAKHTTYYLFYRRLIFALDYAVDKHKHCLARMYVT